MKTIDGSESRHVAPATARVNAILDDIGSVTSTVKDETSRMNQLLDWILDLPSAAGATDATSHGRPASCEPAAVVHRAIR